MKMITTPNLELLNAAAAETAADPIPHGILSIPALAVSEPVARRRSLFTINADLGALETLLIETQGDISDEETAAIIDEWFAENQADFDAKADGYADLMAMLNARAAIRQAEAARISELARLDSALAERLKARLKEFMLLRGTAKLETTFHKFSIQNNGGVQPMVVTPDIDPRQLPAEYTVTTVALNGQAFRQMLANQPAGTTLRLVERAVIRISEDEEEISEEIIREVVAVLPVPAGQEPDADGDADADILSSMELAYLAPRGTQLRIK